jgi:hypothetical protein
LSLGIILCIHPAREPPHELRVGGRCGVRSWGGLRFAGDVVGGKCITLRHQLRIVVADEVTIGVEFVAGFEGRGRLRVGRTWGVSLE